MSYGLGKALNKAYSMTESQTEIDNREMQRMAMLRTSKMQDDQLEEKAQKEMAAYEDKVSEFTKDLLIYDQMKINKKAKLLARGLRENLDGSGNQYTSFMQQSGHRLMQDYKSSVINSDEAITFKENKKNAEQIIKAQLSKMGHLINARDLQSLQDYKNNKGGKITFTGMLSEVQMPDLMSYAFGEEVPTSDILENNYMAIRGNYMLENPDSPEPTKSQLLTYTSLRYGAKGKNTQAQRNKMDQDFRKYKELLNSQLKVAKNNKNGKGDGGSGDDPQYGIDNPGFIAKKSSEILSFMDHAATTTVGDFTQNYWKEKFNRYDMINKIGATSWSQKYKKFNPTEKGVFDVTLRANDDINFGHHFTPRNALRVYDGLDMDIAAVTLDIPETEESNVMDRKNKIIRDYIPSSNAYMADGSSLKGIDLHDRNRSDYKVEGTIIAATASNKDGDGIVMDVYDGDKNISADFEDDENREDALYDKNDKIKPKMFTVLRDLKTDNTYYVPIDLSNETFHKKLDVKLGEYNDVTDIRKANHDIQKDEDMLKEVSEKEVQKLMNFRKGFREDPTSYQSMLVEINSHMTTDGYSDDRAKLIEAFYLLSSYEANGGKADEAMPVMQSMTQDAYFTNSFLSTLEMESGINFNELMKDPEMTNEDLIKKMIDSDPSGNEQFYSTLLDLYKTLKNNS